MSAIYRKSGKRLFYRIDEKNGLVTRVLNKELHSSIDFGENRPLMCDILEDHLMLPSTEEEFNTAYKEAMERISSGKI